MKIGIDISQIAYEGTGVGDYLTKLVENLVKNDQGNEYVLFFSGLRKQIQNSKLKIQNYNAKIKIKTFRIPPTILDLVWNRLHILPIETLIGDVDVFISSDWTQPPVKKAKNVTILFDLVVYKCPNETAKKIVDVQKRRLNWVKKECDSIICISEVTKKDAMEILGIPEYKLKIVYPGI
jgi:hypothetical protein